MNELRNWNKIQSEIRNIKHIGVKERFRERKIIPKILVWISIHLGSLTWIRAICLWNKEKLLQTLIKALVSMIVTQESLRSDVAQGSDS